MKGIRISVATALVAALVIPAAALAQEPAPPAQAAAAPEPAEPAAVAPTAQPAQDDVSGGDQYTEDAPPAAPSPDPEPTDEPADPTPAPQAPSAPAGSAPTATAAPATGESAAVEGLPRTGAEGLVIGLIGLTLLACGTLLRRAAARIN